MSKSCLSKGAVPRSCKRLLFLAQTASVACFIILLLASASNKCYAAKIMQLQINGPIGPATADYITNGVKYGQNADLILIKIDTPGGLDASTRIIMQQLLNSAVPVIAYVSPNGARAASAGTYLLYASTLAAMAPGTQLGAASPVSWRAEFSGEKKPSTVEDKKIANDALATMRSLAQLRGRNLLFAEKSVLDAVSMTADEALQAGVINYIASNEDDLLRQLNGVTILQNNKKIILNTSNPEIERLTPSWFNHLLSILTNPTLAYFLLLLGIYSIFFELINPGFVLPGVVGAVAMLLALYALQLLPINYTGFSLLLLGLAFMIAEGFSFSFGVLGIVGTVTFVLGSMILINSNELGIRVAYSAIVLMAIINIIIFTILVGALYQSRRQSTKNGLPTLIGAKGRTLQCINLRGQAVIRGEIWSVQARAPIPADRTIRVIRATGLLLEIEEDLLE